MGYGEYLKNMYGGGATSTTSTKQNKSSGNGFTDYLKSQYGQTVEEAPVVNSVPKVNRDYSMPTTKVESSVPSDADIVNQYESMPKDNFLKRIFSQEAKDNYAKKQEMLPEYEKAKANLTAQKMANYGIDVNEMLGLYTNNGRNTDVAMRRYLASKGITNENDVADIQDYVRVAMQNKSNDTLTQFADNHGFLGTVASAPINLAAGVGGVVENTANYLAGNPLSANDSANALSRSVNEMRNEVSKDYGTVGKTLYGAGTSALDMGTSLLTGLGPIGMATEKATSTINRGIDRNLTPDQIMKLGLASGVTTYITEKIPMGRIESLAENGFQLGKNTVKEIAKAVGASALSEGSQEALEDIADSVADLFITKDKNEISTEYRNRVANGESSGQAALDVLGNYIADLIMDFSAGAISGGGLSLLGGSFGSARNRLNSNNTNTTNNIEETVPTLENEVDPGQARVDEANRLAQMANRMAEEQASESNLSDLMNQFNAEREASENLANQEQLRQQRFAEENGNPTDLTSLLEQAKNVKSKPIEQTRDYEAYNRKFNEDADEMELMLGLSGLNDDLQRFQKARTYFDNFLKQNGYKGGDVKSWSKQRQHAMALAEKIENIDARNLMKWYVGSQDLNSVSVDPTLRTEPTYNPETFANPYIPSMEQTTSNANVNANSNANVNANANVKNTRAKRTPNANVIPNVNNNTTQNSNVNANNNQGSTIFDENPINNGKTKTSQFAENTMKRSDDFYGRSVEAAKQLEKDIKNSDHTVSRVSEVESVEMARKLLNQDHDRVKNNIVNSPNISNVQIDAGAMLTDEMITNGDFDGARAFAIRMTQKIHDAAQGLQALAKYTRTASGTILKAQQLANESVDNYFSKSKNKVKAEQCTKLANILKNMEYDGSMDVPALEQTYAQIEQGVRNVLSKESASVFKNFDNNDIAFLARLIETNADTDVIEAQLKQKLANGVWGLSDEDIAQIVDLFNKADKAGEFSKEAAGYHAQAYAIASKMLAPKTFMDKWNAWRYLAMLGNPRTHVRNMIGNTIFGTVTNIKDAVGTVVEGIYASSHPDYERTKAITSRATDSELYKGAGEYFNKYAYGKATGGSKYSNLENELVKAQRTFANDVIEKANTTNSNALESEDNYAIKRKYEQALSGYLKANGKDASIFTSENEADIALLERASDYAIKEAKEATFHEENAFAKAVTQFSRNAQNSNSLALKASSYIVESVMPFKTTPANILKQGIQYSPAGFIKAFTDAKSGAEITEVLNSVSKGLTGTGILFLGMLLTSKGILRASGKDDDDGKLFGEQAYSINIGNHSYTIDWAAPAALPLFVGSELYSAHEGDREFIDAITSISQPVIEMSMLQGFDNMLKSIAGNYGMGNAIATVSTDIATGYLTQSVPTLAGQIARTIDPMRRDVYVPDNGIEGSVEYTLEQTQNKIPGLSFGNEEYVDAWGNAQENTGGNVLMRALNNMVLPGYYSNTERTEYEQKLETLKKEYTATGEKANILPDKVGKKYNGETLTAKQKNELQRVTGKRFTEGSQAVMGNADFDSLSMKNQVKALKEMKEFTNTLAKSEVLGSNTEDSSYKKYYGIYEAEGIEGLANYIVTKTNIDSKMPINEKTGRQSTKVSDLIPVLEDSNLSYEEKGKYIYDTKGDSLSEYGERAYEAGGYEALYSYYLLNTFANADGKGNEPSQAELGEYLKQLDMPIDMKYFWYNIFYPDAKELPVLY